MIPIFKVSKCWMTSAMCNTRQSYNPLDKRNVGTKSKETKCNLKLQDQEEINQIVISKLIRERGGLEMHSPHRKFINNGCGLDKATRLCKNYRISGIEECISVSQ